MKKTFYLLGLLWSCAYLLPLNALADSTCTASFNYHAIGRTVQFTSAFGLPPGTVHSWTFGDATGSSDVNPSHTYAAPGTYWVTHYIYNQALHCQDSVVKAVTVTDTIPCNIQPKFSWRRDSVNCLKVYFTNQSILNGNTAHFIWKFGDGTSSTQPNPTHTYAQQGVYTVCLVIETTNGCRKELCQQVEVRCSPPPPPACNVQAKFEWRRDSSQWNKVWFRNLSQPVSNIWRTFWTYGDGTGSQDFNSVHVYQQPGKYMVCLKVQSLNGCINTYCDSVIVRKPDSCHQVRVKFEYRRDSIKPYVLHFRALSNVPIIKQRWVIQKDSSSTFPPPPVVIEANNPTYSFKDSGWYVVCLYAVTSNNCKKTYCERIYIAHGENGRVITSNLIPVYPNPARNLLRLELQLESPAMLQMRVLDGTGTAKIQFTVSAMSGNNHITIPVEKLSNGLYVVEIRYGNQVKLAKFQKS